MRHGSETPLVIEACFELMYTRTDGICLGVPGDIPRAEEVKDARPRGGHFFVRYWPPKAPQR